jgi:serine/threonine protein phosphatase 1
VHAGVIPPGKKWKPDLPGLEPRLWIRDTFLKYKRDFPEGIVVFGHTPQLSGRPLIQRNKIGIDTAAAYGGPLTALALSPDGRVVDAIQV